MKMNKLATIILLLLGGCASTTPNYDSRFGDAVRQAKMNMTINPDAGKNPDQALGMDGKAARETVILYQGTFKEPPPTVNVINIGGPLATGAGGGR
jgi:hypothetical protein